MAQDYLKWLKEYGVDKKPVGMDIGKNPFLQASKKNLGTVDGQQVMLEARIIKKLSEGMAPLTINSHHQE